MLLFTLDTNCIIAVDEARTEAASVRALADAHASGTANVGLVAISASEHQRNGGHLENFSVFQQRLASLGLAHLELLHPMFYFDVTFFDASLLSDAAMEALERQVPRGGLALPLILAEGHPVEGEGVTDAKKDSSYTLNSE